MKQEVRYLFESKQTAGQDDRNKVTLALDVEKAWKLKSLCEPQNNMNLCHTVKKENFTTTPSNVWNLLFWLVLTSEHDPTKHKQTKEKQRKTEQTKVKSN